MVNKIRKYYKAVMLNDQSWFWSKEWQQGEKQAEDDIKKEKVRKFNSTKELFDDLDN